MKLLFSVFLFSVNAIASVTFSTTDHIVFNSEKTENASLMHEMEINSFTSAFNFSVSFVNKLEKTNSAPFFLEKKHASYENKSFRISLGDTHEELGRGIALSLFSNPVFGIDNTIEGFSFHYFGKKIKAKAFGGALNSLDYPVSIYSEENPLINRTVFLAAGEITHPIFENFRGGEHYFIAYENTSSEKRYQTIGAFLSKEAVFDGVNGYIESNALFTQNLSNSSINYPNGYGTYGSLNFLFDNLQLGLELKDYRSYGFDFRRPPTLEEDIVDSINTEDITAIRLSSLLNMNNEIIKFSILSGLDRVKEAALYHIIGETKFDLLTPIEIKAGYRWYPEKLTLYHGSIGSKIKTFKAQSIEIKLSKQVETTNLDFVPIREDRNKLDLGYNFSHRFSITSGLEYIPTAPSETSNIFLNLGVSAKISSLTAKAFIGKTSGGTVCSGGVCRVVPPYSGGMIETIYQF